MTNARIFKLDGIEKTALPFLGRVYKSVAGTGKVLVVQSDITSISRTVRRFNTNAGGFGNVTTTENGGNVPVNPAIFNTLQTDNSWNKDAIGYNFADTVPAADFPGMGAYSIV